MIIDGDPRATEAEATFLREMLYVDTSRVRAYLAQMEDGLPDRVQAVEERLGRWAAGVSVMAMRAEVGRQSSTSQQTERTLSDLHFAIFEEVASSIGFLTDISDRVDNLDDWTSGALHHTLQEGHVIRVTAPTRLTDGEHIIAFLKKFARVAVEMGPRDGDTGMSAGQRVYAAMIGTGEAPQDGSQDLSFVGQLEAFVRLMFDTGIWVRCLPCGAEHPEACFTGVLLDRSDYIDPERFAIFSRYGFQLREWTVVGSVTRISTPTGAQLDLNELTSEFLTPEGLLDRNQFEDLLNRLLEYCESQGITEGPRWPSIVITPLAVYRQIKLPPVAAGA
jgi:hypothetical protein